ncbi:MAG: hypothetical protein K6F30_09770 [Lachnospiraceae bacterium]|nr:hypothetical protein [Lachnospiraceae bacterium]
MKKNDFEEIDLIDEARKINTSYKSYNENEQFKFNNEKICSVLDFWRYQYSNISALGSELAEFFVAKALGIDKAENVNYWTAYDMSYRGKRIEVKFTQYVHFWNKTRVSEHRSFSIEPTKNSYWSDSNESSKKYSRQNDIYVFCLDSNKDITKNNPLCLDDWKFYVVPTSVINDYASERQKKISLNVVKRLADRECNYIELKIMIDNVIDDMQ